MEFNDAAVGAIHKLTRPQAIELDGDKNRVHLIVAGEVHTIEKAVERFDQHHKFPTIEALAQMLDRDRDPQRNWKDETGAITGERQIAVFVGNAEVMATPHYPLSRRVGYDDVMGTLYSVPLGLSREFKALQKLASGVGGKELWRLLVTDLASCVDPSLVLLVSNLSQASKSEAKAQISPTGVVDEMGATSSVNVVFGDGSTARSVQLNWEWQGPVWDAWPEPLKIKLRLELDDSNGFKLIFHPVGLEREVQAHRARMVEWLRGRLPLEPMLAAEATDSEAVAAAAEEGSPALPIADPPQNLLPVNIFEGEMFV